MTPRRTILLAANIALFAVCALGCGSSGSSAALEAPLLDAISPVPASAGMPGVHVGWTNNTPDCDAVEGEHKGAP